jgi:hypothetical protein
MHRFVKTLGKLAVAALAVAATLILATGPARSQDPAVPPLSSTKESAKIVVPGAPADLSAKRAARNASVNVTITRQAAPPGMVLGNPVLVPMANGPAPAAVSINQLRPTFQMELRLLTSAAQPTPSQRREIALEAGRTLKLYLGSAGNINVNNGAAVNQAVRININNGAAVNQVQVARLGATLNDPRRLVRQHLELAAWSKLSNVQSARYRTELDRKERARREVVVFNVVTTLDKHLGLNAQQREKICESLLEHWDDRDYPAIVTAVDYDKYVAIVPPLYIGPILTDEQRKVWAGLRKVHLATVRGLEPANQALAIEVEDDEDEDAKAALAEGPRE